jgi:hypothetical protein
MFVYEIKWWIKHRAAVLAANSAQPSAPPNQPGQ